MSGLRRAVAGLAVAALLAGGGAAAIALTSDHVESVALTISLGLFVGWSFVGTGLFAWWRRPHNRFGPLLTAVGFAWFLGALVAADSPAIFTLGVLLSNLYLVVFVHALLVYPEGRLERPSHAKLIAAGYAMVLIGPLPMLLFGGTDRYCDSCPESLLLVADDETALRVTDALTSAAAVALVAVLVSILVRRWREATHPQRRALAPVLWSGVALLVLLIVTLTTDAARVSAGLTGALMGLATIVFASVPYAFLFGLMHTRMARAGAMSELLMRLGEAGGTGRLRELLAEAVGDRSLDLVFWLDQRSCWCDAMGHRVGLPAPDDPARTWLGVEVEGRRVGAIVYDRSLDEEPGTVRSVAAAAALAVENERLQAELCARVDELRTSRARLVEAGTHERRRLERNLHDGAQQRLVALSLSLRVAQAQLRRDPEKADATLSAASEELTLALGELRELARGIHPAVLSDHGLPAALESLAGRSPVPVELEEVTDDRLPEPVEAAAYFLVSEALTNVVKYARASQATVRVARDNGTAVVEVADDGVGGADPGRGSGLRGLADRVAALDGSMRVDSPPGQGTRLRAVIPV